MTSIYMSVAPSTSLVFQKRCLGVYSGYNSSRTGYCFESEAGAVSSCRHTQ